MGISVLVLSQKVEKSEIQEPPRKMKKKNKNKLGMPTLSVLFVGSIVAF